MTYGSNTRRPHMRGLEWHRDNKDANCNGRVQHKTPGYGPAIHIQQLLSLHHNIRCKLSRDDVIKHDQDYPLAGPHPAPVQPEYAQQTNFGTTCEPSNKLTRKIVYVDSTSCQSNQNSQERSPETLKSQILKCSITTASWEHKAFQQRHHRS